jgi:3-oxoacyl-[acyl-carrier-protein] synthase-1
VAGIGFGQEEATIDSEKPLLGKGLAQAVRAAFDEAKIEMHQIGWRQSDVTGESYGFKEHELMLMRLLRVRREEHIPYWHCAENIGDSGAAAGHCQLVIVYHAFARGYAPGETSLCCTSAFDGKRAAAVLRGAME